ncbi:formyltransferase family protein [Micromonospora marina]|uniref:phosphoribosylglycinamide formyltransferase 1 n=1 Tax=Micromonospora marina TaxID=307120 RepID=A0A1C5A924_9ACTN|nr:formyltransferase family protein [Micromonospora marina]SCF41581.1 Formyl transferase [Micromonospora marina]
MTGTARAESVQPTRYPLRPAVDGDVAPEQILRAVPGTEAAEPPTDGVAAAALAARLWRLDGTADLAAFHRAVAGHRISSPEPKARAVTGPDVTLLHHVETAGLWVPPVAARLAGLTPALAEGWLVLAAHWARPHLRQGDPRYLNAACKLLGGVWLRRTEASGPERESWDVPRLAGLLRLAARLVRDGSAQLAARLDRRSVSAAAAGAPDLGVPTVPTSASARIVVVARRGSGGARRFLGAAASAGLPVAAVCWYEATIPGTALDSGYAQAWYPPEPPDDPAPATAPPAATECDAVDFDELADVLRRHRADLVVLLGMPVVPMRVLANVRLGAINAHNGALPDYRGMDAVGWALLNNDPVVCTVHRVRSSADTGEIIASVPVAPEPAPTLRARVKAAQVALLLAAAAHVARHGELPDTTPQPAAGGTRYYRLHPHLKRLLDASLYAA